MKGKTKISIQGHPDKKWKDSFEGINMKENSKWLLYNLTVAFSLYWAKKRCPLTANSFISFGAIGLLSLLILIAIIKFDIKQ